MKAYESPQLDILGNQNRRVILYRLLRGPMPVGKLAEGMWRTRPAISQHLQILKKAKLVRDRPSGARRLYELSPEGFDLLRQYFDPFWDHIKRIREMEPEPKKKRGWAWPKFDRNLH